MFSHPANAEHQQTDTLSNILKPQSYLVCEKPTNLQDNTWISSQQ